MSDEWPTIDDVINRHLLNTCEWFGWNLTVVAEVLKVSVIVDSQFIVGAHVEPEKWWSVEIERVSKMLLENSTRKTSAS